MKKQKRDAIIMTTSVILFVGFAVVGMAYTFAVLALMVQG